MEKRWAAQISLPGIKDVLLPLVQDSGREKGMNRRPLTEMVPLYRGTYTTALMHITNRVLPTVDESAVVP